jgi:uncharacterized SAM-binding protein YcdF (DUF218 family)
VRIARICLAALVNATSVLLSVGVLLVAFSLHAVLLVAARPIEHRALPEHAPLVVVLGGGALLRADPQRGITNRFERGIGLIEAGIARRIHFTGAGLEGETSEGERMANLARERVPHAEVTFEGRSLSTLQNAYFTALEIGPLPPGSILVTDAAHLLRAWAAFTWMGARGLVLVPANDFPGLPQRDQERMVWREAAGLWVNLGRIVAFTLAGGDPDDAHLLAARNT